MAHTSAIDALKMLHTTLVDGRNGYEEALKDAGPKGLQGLFKEMIALHRAAAVELEPVLAAAGETLQDDGSFMTTVKPTIISIRSLFNELDESILPGLVDGERRVLRTYDEALKVATGPVRDVLTRQRAALVERIAEMETLKAKAER